MHVERRNLKKYIVDITIEDQEQPFAAHFLKFETKCSVI